MTVPGSTVAEASSAGPSSPSSLSPAGAAVLGTAEEKAGGEKRAIVIGGGFGGLAAAIRLRGEGFAVTLIEAREKVGGRAYALQDQGYTFDMGPSLITAPAIFESLFRAVGKSLRDYADLLPLDPYYRVYFHDGTFIDYNGNPESMKEQMRRFDAKDADRYDSYMRAIAPIYASVLEEGLGSRPFHKPSTMLRFFPTAMRLGAYRSAASFAASFFRNFRHRFIFSFHPLYIGGDPFHVPSIYLMIPYLERKQGVWYTRGGMTTLVKALERCLLDAGGKIVTGYPVTGIETLPGSEGGARVRGVRTGEAFHPAEIVVSNADWAHTQKRLLAPAVRRKWTDRKVDGLDYTMSCFLLFLGVKGRYDRLKHHTLILGPRYRELLQDIFRNKVLPEDFSLYVHAPARSEEGMAPPGNDSLFVLAPVANLQGAIDWKREAAPFAERLIDFLQEWGLEGLRERIEVRHVFTPLDFESRLQAQYGNAFGLEPKLAQTGYFRPHNKSEDVQGLYFAGAGTHPGAGLPGVLLSAEAVLNCIREDGLLMKRGKGGL